MWKQYLSATSFADGNKFNWKVVQWKFCSETCIWFLMFPTTYQVGWFPNQPSFIVADRITLIPSVVCDHDLRNQRVVVIKGILTSLEDISPFVASLIPLFSVAYPECPNSRAVRQPTILQMFYWKLHENERIWTGGRLTIDPWIRHCFWISDISALGFNRHR